MLTHSKVYFDFDLYFFHWQLEFLDFFKEERSTYTNPKVREIYGTIYKYTKLGFYNFFVIVCGLPAAVIWGIVLSVTSFFMNWIYTPILKVIMWFMDTTFPVFQPIMECIKPCVELLQPVCAKIGRWWAINHTTMILEIHTILLQ